MGNVAKLRIELSVDCDLLKLLIRWTDCFCPTITGIGVKVETHERKTDMHKFTLVKRMQLRSPSDAPPKQLALHDPAPVVFPLVDNGDGTFTVTGQDSAGVGGIDISAVATMTVVSDSPDKVTVDEPTGMTCAFHAASPVVLGTAMLNGVVTWNDGSKGPFNFQLQATVVQGETSGVNVTLGPITTR